MHALRHTLRQLAKTPGFTAVAILTLAVGIGSAASMFSALHALVVEPFSYPHSEQIVHVWSNDGQPLSQPDYWDLTDRLTLFSELGGYSPRTLNLGGEKPECVPAVACTSGVLRTFGIPAALGRLLSAEDDQPGAPGVVVISHALWQRSFAGDPQILGRSLRLDGTARTIVGVMPAHFEFSSPWQRGGGVQLWVPLGLKRGEGDRGSHWFCMVGRLKPGVTVEAADAEVKAIGRQLKAEHPNTNSQKPFLVRTLRFEMTRFIGSRVWMLFGAVSLVLLVACANVASMLLSRSARRQGEFGVRVALGATRADIVRLALVESAVLAAGGALLGILFAFFGTRILGAIAPVTDARRAAMTLDGGVLAFTVAATALAAFVAGLPPALASLRLSVTELLRADSRAATGSRTRHNLLRGLIIAQIAIAFALANGAALFSASYVRLLSENQALATEYVVSARLQLSGARYAGKPEKARAWDQFAERLQALPGVTAAGLVSKLPLEGGSNMNILVKDQVFDPMAHRILAEISAATPDYFRAAGIGLIRGRTLQPSDAEGGIQGVVVNRALAEQAWPGEDPLGQLVRNNSDKADFTGRVVGVVEDVRQWGPEMPAKPEIFWSPSRAWGDRVYLLVRSSQPAAQFGNAMRQAVASIDPELPLTDVRTLQRVVEDATKGQRVVAGLVDFFMAVALGLVAVGLYGTLSYHVLQRTREIGVRVALGATRRDVLRLVLRQGFGWVAVGIVLGVGGAIALTSTLKSMVYGMQSVNPAALGLAVVTLAAATYLACWLPARRAANLNPTEALRG